MPSVRYLTLFLACVAVFAAGTSASIIDGLTPYYDETPQVQTFKDVFDDSPVANIQCNVYNYSPAEYLYTYQIYNPSAVDLSFVSMQIFGGVDVGSSGFEAVETGDVLPNTWGPVGSPVHSFDGHFNDTILSGQQSALLWFVSDGIPTDAGQGAIFGTYRVASGDSWAPVYAEGNLITPNPALVPEPATFFLISMGTFAIIGRRRKSQEAV